MTERTVKTVCNLCGLSGCGMEITVKDGKVVKVEETRITPKTGELFVPRVGRSWIYSIHPTA